MTIRSLHNLFTIGAQRRGPDCWRLATLLRCLLLISAMDGALAAEASEGPATRTKEYFHYQEAGAVLVARLQAFESEFESRIYGPENVLLKASAVPSLRLGPVFQFIEPVTAPRQLRIEVTQGRSTSRAKLDMQLIKFDQDGPDSSVLLKAYRLLSFGLEIEKSKRYEQWTLKVVSLKQASEIFDFLGMQELQLWSEFYAGFYLLAILGDPVSATESAREIYPAATRSGFKDLALAAVQLEGSATAAQINAGTGRANDVLFDRAQALFSQAAELAATLDLQHERARAVFNSGLTYEVFAQNDLAFTQFELALSIATASGDTDLSNQVRQHAAELHESLGENAEAIALMQQISASAPQEKPSEEAEPEDAPAPAPDPRSGREMVNYLFEQGRLLEKTYRHEEAAAVLLQALELNEGLSPPALAGPIMLLLGKALYGAGQTDAALEYLQTGIKKTPASGHDSELEQANGTLANIQRARGDFAGMAEARARQDLFISAPRARAAFTLERAFDALAQGSADSTDALTLLRQSESLARESGARSVQYLAQLQLCAVGECPGGQGPQALAALESSALPGAAQQARWLWSQALRRSGQLAQSTRELDRLIEDMRFFQAYLPGVLGAWYWHNSEMVFRAFMDQTLEQAGPSSGEAAALSSLAALDRLSRMSRHEAVMDMAGSVELDRLRSLFAEREAVESAAQASQLEGEIARLLQQARPKALKPAESAATLANKLDRLSDDEGLLTYYIASGKAFAWVGSNSSLKLIGLRWTASQSGDLSRKLEGLRWDLANGGAGGLSTVMDGLGEVLLAPVARQLPKNIYFLPLGRMQGLPLDALRSDGVFLGATHRVINLTSLDALGSAGIRVESDDLQRFFLAGNQLSGAGDFGVSKPTPMELKKVTDLFVGPGLHVVQGSALQWDEFEVDAFTRAGVIHLAMPGIIDLRDPAQSRLLLSDNTDDIEHEFLLPGDIAEKSFSTKLVVMSDSDFVGTSPSAFDANSRFVADFLAAGAGTVIASLWSVGDQAATEFMLRFYRKLQVNPSVGEALYEAKKSYLESSGNPDSGAWAAFQLFVH